MPDGTERSDGPNITPEELMQLKREATAATLCAIIDAAKERGVTPRGSISRVHLENAHAVKQLVQAYVLLTAPQ